MNGIKALFLDLGGVLFYDEYVELFFLDQTFKLVNKHTFNKISVDSFFHQREILYKKYSNNWINIFILNFVSSKVGKEIIHLSWEKTLENFRTVFKPYPDSKFLLSKLHAKFDLYCLANQPYEAEKIIDNLGYTKFFKKFFIDTTVGFSKPDIRFFQNALTEIRLMPAEVIHIGDRIDNDILPALNVGMRCIKLTQPIRYLAIENIPHDFTNRFYQSLNKVWHRWEKLEDHSYQDVFSYEQLLHKIAIIQSTTQEIL